jgi:malonyl CoA-acyl carrier protein transacylase
VSATTADQISLAEQTAMATAQQLLPVILAGVSAGASAASPAAATIAALAPVIVQLIQMRGAGAAELASIMSAMTSSVGAAQAQIDAAAAARGVVDPTVTPATPAP